MNSKKLMSLSKKLKKWAAGKPEQDYEIFFLPAKESLESYVNDIESKPNLSQALDIHASLGAYAAWNFDKFLDLHLNKDKEDEKWFFLTEAMNFRILEFSLGYANPANTAPFNDAHIGLSICDSIVLDNGLGRRLIDGYSNHDNRPNLNPQSIIQFSYLLFSAYKKTQISTTQLFKAPLIKLYSALLQNIEADFVNFNSRFEEACEYHIERSNNSIEYEFSFESDMLVPSELLAVLKFRKHLGYDIAIEHALVTPFLDFLSFYHNPPSDFYNKVRDKLLIDYL